MIHVCISVEFETVEDCKELAGWNTPYTFVDMYRVLSEDYDERVEEAMEICEEIRKVYKVKTIRATSTVWFGRVDRLLSYDEQGKLTIYKEGTSLYEQLI